MERSMIEWTDDTFNPWIGCTRVSEGCVHCYAEFRAARFKQAEWGPGAKRVRTGAAYWEKPRKWNKEEWVECSVCGWRDRFERAMHAGPGPSLCPICESPTLEDTRRRVFCASMADVFERNPQVANWRGELFGLMDATPNLDWLVLTKRPEEVFSLGTAAVGEIFDLWLARRPNVWIGASMENQREADRRAESMLKVMPAIRFVSVEPMLERVRIPHLEAFDWVICGGESGAGCRPFEWDWARALRDECREAGVAFFMKQGGGFPRKRDRLEDLPADLRIREWPMSRRAQ